MAIPASSTFGEDGCQFKDRLGKAGATGLKSLAT